MNHPEKGFILEEKEIAKIVEKLIPAMKSLKCGQHDELANSQARQEENLKRQDTVLEKHTELLEKMSLNLLDVKDSLLQDKIIDLEKKNEALQSSAKSEKSSAPPDNTKVELWKIVSAVIMGLIAMIQILLVNNAHVSPAVVDAVSKIPK